MKNLSTLCITVLLFSILSLYSCQKEQSFEQNQSGSNGGNNSFIPGWTFKNTDKTFTGCVDTAYFDQSTGIKVLSIEGSDAPGNAFMIFLYSPSGNITKTTYTGAQGSGIIVSDSSGNTYISGAAASTFTFTVTAITDTSISGNFSASLTDPVTNAAYMITSGTVNALIGKANGCSQNTGGNTGGGTGGGTGGNTGGNTGSTSEYTLVSSGTACADVSLEGNYNTGVALTSANKAIIQVNVIKTGTWSITTETVNGIKFSGSGTFSTTGAQSIILAGSGTPAETGRFDFPFSTGTADCNFAVSVIGAGTASCNPAVNTADFSGVASFSFYSVMHDTNAGGYTITANGMGGDLSLQFAGTTQPKPGVYHVKPVGGASAVDDVAVYAVASSVLWQSSQGNVYVTVANNKVTAVLCDIPFTGSLGGPAFTTKLTAKITEP
jgi:hypothetical protein